jgi:hypothetical protein
MTTSTWTQTDYATQPISAYFPHVDGNTAVAARIADAFAAHEQTPPDATVAVDAGHIFDRTALIEVPAQTTGVITAPVGNPRIDRVVVDQATGLVSVVTGVAAASPVPPAIPAGKVPVARLDLDPKTSAITNAEITDERDFSMLGADFSPVDVETGSGITYDAADHYRVTLRSNGGGLMQDVLPGSGAGVMREGWQATVANGDATAILVVSAGSGAMLDGSATGKVYLGPGQRATFVSDGSSYLTKQAPDRCRLGADTTFLVSTGGADTNSGLGSAWRTIQHAVDMLMQRFDGNGYKATIAVADGTYAENVLVSGPFLGIKDVILSGNVTTPANCIISATSSCLNVFYGGRILVQGFKLTSTGARALTANYSSLIVVVGKVEFGTVALQHCWAAEQSSIQIQSNYTISGSTQYHWCVEVNSGITVADEVITLTGTPNFSIAFALTTRSGSITCVNTSFSGGATGKRYEATMNGTILTNAGSTSFFPGNLAGTTATGGQYV